MKAKRNTATFSSHLPAVDRAGLPAPTSTRQFHYRRLHSQHRAPKPTVRVLHVRTDVPSLDELNRLYAADIERGQQLSKSMEGES